MVHGVVKNQTRRSDFTFIFTHWRRKWQPTPVLLPEESQGWRNLVGYRLWGCIESDMTEATQQQHRVIRNRSTPPGPTFSHPRPCALHPHIHAAQASSLPPLSSQSLGFAEVFWPWGRKRKPTPVFLPGKSHGLQSMGSQRVGHS